MNSFTNCFICKSPEINEPFHGLAKEPVCSACRELILSAKKEIPRYLKGAKHKQPAYIVKMKPENNQAGPKTMVAGDAKSPTANLNVVFEFSNGGNWMCVNINDEKG